MILIFPTGTTTKHRHVPLATILLIVANIFVFAAVQPHGKTAGDFFRVYGFQSANAWWSSFTALFLHNGALHLAGNMVFLWLAGSAIEESWGVPVLLSVYFLGGVVACWGQALIHNFSLPMVGASGAVAALMGAFWIRYFRHKLKFFYAVFVPPIIRFCRFTAPVWMMLLLWLVMEIGTGFAQRGEESTRVAYWAHVSGFVFGTLFAIGVRSSGHAARRERIANTSVAGLYGRLEEACDAFGEGRLAEAERGCRNVVMDQPENCEALAGLLLIRETVHETRVCGSIAVALMQAALRTNNKPLAVETYRRWQQVINFETLSEGKRIALAESLESIGYVDEAIDAYMHAVVASKEPAGTGKLLFRLAKLLKREHRLLAMAQSYFRVLQQEPYSPVWGDLATAELPPRRTNARPTDTPIVHV